MIAALKKIIHKTSFYPTVKEKGSVEAYDIWAENYDKQPGNLMLDLDEQLFAELLTGLDLENKSVADIGCGTGRHWPKLLGSTPSKLAGFDVSPGMLNKLKAKFPDADVHTMADNLFSAVPDNCFDVIVSTLTVAHIHDIEQALQAWSRILKRNADIIITDFHPNALAFGGKRTFQYHNATISVENFVHYVYDIEEILRNNNFQIVNKLEKVVDESVKHYYIQKNALPVYEKFAGSRIIYGLHLKRRYNGIE